MICNYLVGQNYCITIVPSGNIAEFPVGCRGNSATFHDIYFTKAAHLCAQWPRPSCFRRPIASGIPKEHTLSRALTVLSSIIGLYILQ